jgi:regulator of replication initiation timing
MTNEPAVAPIFTEMQGGTMQNDKFKYDINALFTDPLFRMGFFDFFIKMQQDGIEAAKKFWSSYPQKSALFPNAIDLYERIADFYIMLGIVPKTNYDNVLKENASLKEENKFLTDTLRELQVNIFKTGGEKAQEIWHSSIDKQLAVNKEIAKNFFELFRMLKGGTE